ncbi:hypothetical protein [Paraburkholderia sp. DHOC27]|uniref:hypothetical protein n=1 Tax=Paraburkholderia sp. DHOC27 TaxID=2303330 RepID=UPI00216B5C5D|nr:hypothetical protein [Paraburkholderia sp. DHOC27]
MNSQQYTGRENDPTGLHYYRNRDYDPGHLGITYRRADGSVLGDLTYGYDLAGHRTKAGGSLAKVNLPQAVSDAQYNGANQLVRWAGRTITYDANGNLASDGVNQYG